MGKSWLNESSKESFRVCPKNGQIMGKIIWRDRVALGQLTVKEFP